VPKIIIERVPPYDGEYEFDDSSFTNRELHTIKQISGVRPGEFLEAGAALDNDLVVALTIIALRRAGHTVNEDAIWDAEVGRITFADSAAAGDAGPPPQPNVEQLRRLDVPTGSSGTSGSETGGNPPASGQSPTGTQG
jgi:hypothetical protein